MMMNMQYNADNLQLKCLYISALKSIRNNKNNKFLLKITKSNTVSRGLDKYNRKPGTFTGYMIPEPCKCHNMVPSRKGDNYISQ